MALWSFVARRDDDEVRAIPDEEEREMTIPAEGCLGGEAEPFLGI